MAVLLLVASGAAAFSATPGWAGTAARPPSAPPTSAAPLPPPKASILVDAGTGKVVDGLNDHAPLPPASLTKVITALAVGDLAPSLPIKISDRAAAAPADKLFMKAGTLWSADQLMHELLISSANDAAVALAEQAGGTLEGFQQIFARTALALGMADHPVLIDPAGLDGPDGVDGGNLVSACDLAIASRALLAKPALAAIVATPVYYFDGPDGIHHRLTNHNKLFLTTYAGAIGLKTGYTKRAGSCLIAAARRDGRTMLAVVLAGANPTQPAKDLLDKGFATPVEAEPAADQLPPVNLAAAVEAAPDTVKPAAPAPVPLATAGAAPNAGRAGTAPSVVVLLGCTAAGGVRVAGRTCHLHRGPGHQDPAPAPADLLHAGPSGRRGPSGRLNRRFLSRRRRPGAAGCRLR